MKVHTIETISNLRILIDLTHYVIGMSDLYVKVWPEGCPPQETDTHWRCKKGKASWNYRLLFDVELGHSTKAMKFPYLHLQLWDRYETL